MKHRKINKWIGLFIAILFLIILFSEVACRLPDMIQRQRTVENSIQVTVHTKEGEQVIMPWHGQEKDVYYFFLPSYAEMKMCSLRKARWVKNLEIDGNAYQSQDSMENLEQNQVYQASYTIKQEQHTISISFVQSANVHTFYIDTASGSMNDIHESKGNEETGALCVMTPAGEIAYQGRLESVRGRGNNSWFNDKKAYQIKLLEKADLLGMGEAKTWILLAGAADGTAMRNKLVYDMAQDLGIQYAQDTAYVDLYLNGEYAGNYLLTEKIQIKENRIDIPDLEKATEKLNGGAKNLQKATVYRSEDGNRWGFTDAWNPEDITGSYLIERDNFFEEEPSAFRLQSGEKFSISSPKYATREELDYIADTMQQIENAILAEDGVDPKTGKNYKDLIDFNGLVYKYLFDEVTKCDDGWRGSNYFYKMPDSIDTKVYCGPLWDYDLSLGNAPEWFVGDEKPEGIIQTRLSNWYAALWEKQEFQDAVITTYNNVFKPYMQALIADGGGIDANVAIVEQSAKMNLLRWQWKRELSLALPDYESQIAFLKLFIEKRLAYMDEVWNEGIVYHEVLFTGVPKLYNRTDKYDYQYIIDGGKLTVPPEPKKENAEFLGWYYEDSEEKLDPSRQITENVTLEAHWKEYPTEPASDVPEEKKADVRTIITLILVVFLPGFLTLGITSRGHRRTKWKCFFSYLLYTVLIMALCDILLLFLGSSRLGTDSLSSGIYVIKYSCMAVIIAALLGVGIGEWQKRKEI